MVSYELLSLSEFLLPHLGQLQFLLLAPWVALRRHCILLRLFADTVQITMAASRL